MKYKPKKQYRLKNFDYSSNGAYFVTICTKNHESFFGGIKDGKMIIFEIGKIVMKEWLETPKIRKNVFLDEWILMPNHLHGIIVIRNDSCRNVLQYVPTEFKSPSQTLGAVIRGFKDSAKKKIFESGFYNFAWQLRFHDRVIRGEDELNRIRGYIFQNTLNWELGKTNLQNLDI